ncbi:MAG: DUF5615 family PIN-like protein [Thermodesulfobacteriota bacterium]
MSVSLHMDEHVHRAITTGLRLRKVDVLTVQEDDRRNTEDDILLDRATELGRVLFSQDEDMLAETKRRQTEGVRFSGVIYAHQLRITIGACVHDLESIARAADPKELANRIEYLPL